MAAREAIESVLRSGTAARRAGQFKEALRLMNEAAALCGSDQDYERAHVLRELGELARNNHDLNAAQHNYEQAVLLLQNSQDTLEFAHTIRHLGDIHSELHHWLEAERYFVEALAIYQTHPSPATLDLANAIRAYAVLKSEVGQHEAARALWAEAGELYQSEGIAAGVAECRHRADRLT